MYMYIWILKFAKQGGFIVKLKVLYNSDARVPGLKTGWGVSFLIDEKLLFDTGEGPEGLLHNIRELGVDILKIERIIISHDHWDHTGGLWELLRLNPKVAVYACRGFSEEFQMKVKDAGARLIFAQPWEAVAPGFILTGEMECVYKGKKLYEQSLIVETSQGLHLITGCPHPGIKRIVEKVQVQFQHQPVVSMLGGFHLINESKNVIEDLAHHFQAQKIQRVGPTHCSGKAAQQIFQKAYPTNLITLYVGEEVQLTP